MTRVRPQAKSPARRMQSYRSRLRAAGLRPVQVWLPDTRAPNFIRKCRAQAKAIAANDPAGEEMQSFIEAVYEWPRV